MFNITNNQLITITRGDSALMNLYVNLGTDIAPVIYKLGDHDRVYLGISEPNESFENALVKKVFTKADQKLDDDDIPYIEVKFNSEDTEYLIPGVYYYSVKLLRKDTPTDKNQKIDTLIPRKKFIIVE